MAFGISPIRIPIVGVDKFSKEFGAISKKLTRAGQNLARTGQTLTRNVTLPVVAAGAAVLATAGSFESGMNQVQVLTNATSKEFSILSDRARELGSTTQFSASEAADAMGFLAMAGFNVQETYDALPGTLQLAAAAGTDLGTAADIASNVLTAFGKDAAELTQVNDVLANTFTRTNTNMIQLAEGMKFVAPVASAMGINIEETSAALGLLGNAGIQASMAGTTLRGALSRLAAPSGEAVKALQGLKIKRSDLLDAQGNVISLTNTVRVFEEAGAGATELLEIFGQRAGPGMAALVRQGSAALQEQTEANRKSGTAARVAEARMKGLFGQLKKLRSAAQELAISIGEAGLLQSATDLAEVLTRYVRRIGELNPGFLNFATKIAMVAAVLGPLLVVVGTAIKLWGFLAGTIGVALGKIAILGKALAIVKGVLAVIFSPIGLFIASLWSIVNTIRLIIKHWDSFMFALSSKFNFLQTLNFFLADIAKSLASVLSLIPGLGGIADELDLASQGFEQSARERAAAEFGQAQGRNVGGDVLVRVQSEGPPIRAERRRGENLRLETDTGPAYAGG